MGLDFLVRILADGSVAEAETEKVTAGFGRISETLGRVGARIAEFFAAREIVEFARRTIDTVSIISEQADQVAVSAEKFQEWSEAIRGTRATTDDLALAMKALKLSMSEALGNAGSPAASFFGGLGISLDAIRASSPDQIFERIAEASRKMGNTFERTTILANLLGRGAEALGPAFDRGFGDAMRTARQAGKIISDEEIAKIKALHDDLDDLSKMAQIELAKMLGSSLPRGISPIAVLTHVMHRMGKTDTPSSSDPIAFGEAVLSGYNDALGAASDSRLKAARGLVSALAAAGPRIGAQGVYDAMSRAAAGDEDAQATLKLLREIADNTASTLRAVKESL